MIAVDESRIGVRDRARCDREEFCHNRKRSDCATNPSHRPSHFRIFLNQGTLTSAARPRDCSEHRMHKAVRPDFVRSDL
jgi:hypothetical protein